MIAVDHVGVAHPGDAALGADVGRHALEGHDGDGAGVLGDLGLLGGDDVHDHAALEHLGHAALDAGGAGRRGDGAGGGVDGGGVVLDTTDLTGETDGACPSYGDNQSGMLRPMPSLPVTFAEDVLDQPAPRPVRGVPRRAPRGADRLPGRADRGAGPPVAGAVPDDAARAGQARDLRREGLVRRGHHLPVACRDRHPRDAGRVVRPRRRRHHRHRPAGAPRGVRGSHAARRHPWGSTTCVHGNRRGPLPLRWVYLHMLRELAQHCGHADILREQLVSQS